MSEHTFTSVARNTWTMFIIYVISSLAKKHIYIQNIYNKWFESLKNISSFTVILIIVVFILFLLADWITINRNEISDLTAKFGYVWS